MRRTLSLALLMLVCLVGCGKTQETLSDSVNFDLASEPTIFVDNWVRRSAVSVYVHPDSAPNTPPTALFMPLRITQQMENATVIGHNISRLIWQNWLQSKALRTLEFARVNTPYRPDIALSMAKQRGADLVVGGYITHFMDGGTVGDSVVSLAIEIYDVRTGNLLWSMAQGGIMPRSSVSDYLVVATQSRMPADPVSAVVSALATDMGVRVRDWISPQPPERPWRFNEPKAFQ